MVLFNLHSFTQVIQREGLEDKVSAMEVCGKLLDHVRLCTEKKRSYLEQVDRDDHNLTALNQRLRRARDKEISRLLRELPGKLDHAAVVAAEVGHFSADPVKLAAGGKANGSRRMSLLDFISGIRRNTNYNRRASASDIEDSRGSNSSNEMESCDSYTELYSLLG